MSNRVRIYEPYGFGETYKYESIPTRIDNELAESQTNDSKQFASVSYNEDAKALIFKNVNNVEQGRVYLKDIIGLETLIKRAYYDENTKELVIVFNEEKSDVVRIPLDKIIDVTEAGKGLIQDGGKFNVLIDADSESYLTVSQNGVKLSGVNDAITLAFTTERNRAVAKEIELDKKIENEKNRAIQAETDLNNGLMAEIRNRESADKALSNRIDTEISNRTAADIQLQNNINTEANNRLDGDNAIRAIIGNGFTSTPTETITQRHIDLGQRIDKEIADRTTQDNVLQTNINNEVTARSGEITRIENLLTNESNIRIANVQSLNNRIDSEETARKNDDKALTNALNQEISDRTDADAVLQLKVDSEANERATADSQLQDAIDAHTANTIVHVTQSDKDNWNGKAEVSSIPTKVSQLINDEGYLVSSDLTSILSRLSSLEERVRDLESRN